MRTLLLLLSLWRFLPTSRSVGNLSASDPAGHGVGRGGARSPERGLPTVGFPLTLRADARVGRSPIREALHHQREDTMKRILLGLAAAGCLGTTLVAQQTDPQPTCKMCPGTY